MKRRLKMGFWGVVLAAAPLFTGCETDSANAADSAASVPPPPPAAMASNPSGPQVAATQMAEPGLPSNVDPQSPLAEVIKLAQAGVGESVIVTYINGSGAPFQLTTDQIIYVRDLGLSDASINAMIQRDQALGVSATAQSAASSPQAPTAPPPPAQALSAPLTPPAGTTVVETVPNDPNYTYFYDSLTPYGSWVYVQDYGYCWQPTVVNVDRTWQPYCNSGHWVYTDCGWYWSSEYSWGWAPFHYGRWFHHPSRGWCWSPDRTWGPAWVTWRYNDNYCGWAPLPPGSHFRPGAGFEFRGRHVDAGFNFGISADFFTFVSVGHFTDRRPWEHRAPRGEHTRIYNNTTVINNYVVGNNNTIVNNGIGRDRIERANHTTIRPVHIEENNDRNPAGGRHERFQGGNLVVNRPPLNEHAEHSGRTIPHFDSAPRNLPGNQNAHDDHNSPGNHNSSPVLNNNTGSRGNNGPANAGNNNGRDNDHRDNNPATRSPFTPAGQNTSGQNANGRNDQNRGGQSGNPGVNSGNNNQGSHATFRQPTPAANSPIMTAPSTAPGIHTTTPGTSTTTGGSRNTTANPRSDNPFVNSGNNTFRPGVNQPRDNDMPRYNSPRNESQIVPSHTQQIQPTFPRTPSTPTAPVQNQIRNQDSGSHSGGNNNQGNSGNSSRGGDNNRGGNNSRGNGDRGDGRQH